MNYTDLCRINMYGMYTTWHVLYHRKAHQRQEEAAETWDCGL
jgi:hypothetical protein